MFQYEFEKPPTSSESCTSRTTIQSDWSCRTYPTISTDRGPNASRPLPPRPDRHRIPDKTSVPLKVWIIASASCFAVCGALVLATVFITKWGTEETYSYTTRELIETPARVHAKSGADPLDFDSSEEIDLPILEKLSIFKNIVANREHKNLISKTQIHPLHEDIQHEERNIKKKDRAIIEDHTSGKEDVDYLKDIMPVKDKDTDVFSVTDNIIADGKDENNIYPIIKEVKPDEAIVNIVDVPKFKPLLPSLARNGDMDLTYGLDAKEDYFYNDENFYDDYMQSNTMTSYLIEKVQELHDWVSTDPELNSNRTRSGTDFTSLLKALNESMIDGNLTIVMTKLRDMYFGDNYTHANNSRKVIITNSTDLLSFGILTLDVMLLHNIQLMAWENQEAARVRMLKDPDVFAFNALFLDPTKMELKQNDINDGSLFLKRLNSRQDPIEDADIGKNFLENILDVGMSTARAAIHLGRAYKNTKNIISQIQNKNTTVPSPISRNIDANTHALNRLQTSFDSTSSVANANISSNGSFYTELDCVWLLYCRNLVATTKLNAPYGTMARINGVALRMLTGELPANRALDAMIYEVLTGWTELKCNDMFPRCSKVNAAAIVMDSILQGNRKPTANRGR